MADQPKPTEAKTLEMRVAELEDKLSRVHITEDEMRAFQKVSALMAGQGTGVASAATTAASTPALNAPIAAGCISQCIINQCIFQCIIRQCTIARFCTIIQQCINECQGGGGGFNPGGGGFGTLGM